MKTATEVLEAIERRLKSTWADTVVAEQRGDDAGSWPYSVSLGRAKSAELAGAFGDVPRLVSDWRAWATTNGVELLEQNRRVSGTDQSLPTHIRVPDIDRGAAIVGQGWPDKLERGRRHAALLVNRFPDLERPARMVTATDGHSDVDFSLLLDAADWFAASNPDERAGLTPRQVPIEGLHAKWLNTRKGLIAELASLEGLGLLPDHPARVHFTYLDPTYLAAGGRRHDSASVGDTMEMPYEPRVVLISENKDTAVGFPSVPGGLAVEGVGRGALTHAEFDWIVDAPVVVYWGDMDADGLEILNEFRAAGIATTSLLMDLDAFAEWERFGTNSDPQGKALGPRPPRPVEHLTAAEAALYAALISPGWERFRRIEQERIPLTVAHAALLALVLPTRREPAELVADEQPFDPNQPGSSPRG